MPKGSPPRLFGAFFKQPDIVGERLGEAAVHQGAERFEVAGDPAEFDGPAPPPRLLDPAPHPQSAGGGSTRRRGRKAAAPSTQGA
jgi:hypothetical protein